jgi:hypothetical protein
MLSGKVWRIVFCFAIAGFLIPEFAVLSFAFRVSDVLTNLMTLVSPGMWLLSHSRWSAAHRGWLVFAVMPMANAAVYAALGAVITGLITKRKT